MNNKHKLFEIIATSVAIIGFSLAACTFNVSGDDNKSSSSNNNSEQSYNHCITAAGLCLDGPFTVSQCNGQDYLVTSKSRQSLMAITSLLQVAQTAKWRICWIINVIKSFPMPLYKGIG